MITVDGIVEFAAELTFRTEYGRSSTASPGTADVRTASKLTVVVTDAHGRTTGDLKRLFDRVLDDRAALFDSVRIDSLEPATTTGVGRELYTHLEREWDDTIRTGTIDSYYAYEPDRTLVTPERYPEVHRSELEAGSETPAEVPKST